MDVLKKCVLIVLCFSSLLILTIFMDNDDCYSVHTLFELEIQFEVEIRSK